MKPQPLLLSCFPLLLIAPLLQAPERGALPPQATVLATGQALHPAGTLAVFPGRPTDLALSPDGKSLYIKDNRGLVVIDTATWKVRQELPFPSGGGSMHGIIVNPAGTRLYATTAQNAFDEAEINPQGQVAWKKTVVLPGPNGEANSHPCGIALSQDGKTAYVCLSRNNTLGIVDITAGKLTRQIPVGVAPWGVVLSPDENTAYVSNWGGRSPKPGEKTALSSGTPTLVDARGVASSGTISIVNLQQNQETLQLPAGLHPCDLKLTEDGKTLCAANANSDTVSIFDLVTRTLRETLSVHPDRKLLFGSAPNAIALDKSGKTLYVANGGNNAIAVVELGAASGRKSRVRGYIPVGWYPGGIVTDGKFLYVANIKGIGRQSAQAGKRGWNVLAHEGAASRVAIPGEAALRAYTAQALADARIPHPLHPPLPRRAGKTPTPIPERVGEPSVFKHVVYILKENRTYDQVFGDMPQADSDPALCLFGRSVTPNHHALAEQFVLLDNFFCNSVLSADGHSWATEGNVTDHLEKSFGGFTRSYTFGDDPLTYSSSGFLWDNALRHGLTFRNYGEMDYAEPVPSSSFEAIYRDYVEKTGKINFQQKIGIERLQQYSCREYPGWNLNIPDVLRAERFLAELKQAERSGAWPDVVLVYLPNDHTSGTKPGSPTPRAQLADNDLALGRIVEGISQSAFWPQTCIFVVEDDPQDGFDHVDGHRSPALIISPYTRRGKVIHTFYNQTSVLHTMERILRLPPMNQMDALAPLMQACFQREPVLRPYVCLPNRIPLDEINPPLNALHGKARFWAQKSAELPLAKADQADEDTLNHILWYARKGFFAPYPTRFDGAHEVERKRLPLRVEKAEQSLHH